MKRLSKEEVSSILINYYKDVNSYKEFRQPFKADSIFNLANGLGDSLILSSFLRDKKVNNRLLDELNNDMQFCVSERFTNDSELDIAEIARYNWGGGHCTQRIQRALGLPISVRPCPILKEDKKPFKDYVFVHLTTDTDWKRSTPNSLNSDVQNTVSEFFNNNKNLTPYYFMNDLPLPLLFTIMSKCEYFLGIDSGPMHIAAGLGLKSIVIINNIGNNIYLPRIKECDIPNSEWLYPQNIHLNTMGGNHLVPSFSLENLVNSFVGDVYPYFSEEYLTLYLEKNLDYGTRST
jgi:hypothetical protein